MGRLSHSLALLLLAGCASAPVNECRCIWSQYLANLYGSPEKSCAGNPQWGVCPSIQDMYAMLEIGMICADIDDAKDLRSATITEAAKLGKYFVWRDAELTEEDQCEYLWMLGGLYSRVDRVLNRRNMTDPLLTGEPFPFVPVDELDLCFEELGCKETDHE